MARRQGPGVTAQFLPGVTLGSPGVWDKGSDSSITVGLRASMLGLSVQVPSAWGPGAGLGGDKVQELDQEGKRPRSWIRRDGGPGAGPGGMGAQEPDREGKRPRGWTRRDGGPGVGPGGIGRWGAEMRPGVGRKAAGHQGKFLPKVHIKDPKDGALQGSLPRI